jgi:hypothetical protein
MGTGASLFILRNLFLYELGKGTKGLNKRKSNIHE